MRFRQRKRVLEERSADAAVQDAVEGEMMGLRPPFADALVPLRKCWTAAYHLMKKAGAQTPPSTVTSEFHVKLKRITPMDKPLRLRARFVESKEDTAVVEAEIVADGKVTATCRGTFVAVREGHPAYHRWQQEKWQVTSDK